MKTHISQNNTKAIIPFVFDILMLGRPLAFIGIFLVFICDAMIAKSIKMQSWNHWLIIIVGALSCSLLSSAAYVVNNISDIEIDRVNKPSRPLPTRRISMKTARWVAIVLYVLSGLLASLMNRTFLVIFFIMAVLTIVYSCPPLRLKKYGYWANITIALVRGILLVLIAWSITGDINHPFPWYFGALTSLYLFGATSTKDISDVAGDHRYQCLTFPVKFGTARTATLIKPFLTGPFLLIPLGVYLNIFPMGFLVLTLLGVYSFFMTSTIISKPRDFVFIEGNHVSWVHAHFIYILLHLGAYLCYMLK